MNMKIVRSAITHPVSILAWIRKKGGGFVNVPISYIEVSALCNLDCRICFAPGTEEELGIMNRKSFRRIAGHTLPYIYSVNFVGYGDPLVNKDIAWMVRHVRSYGRAAHLTTNGSLLDRDLARDLIRSGLASMAFSLDGATAETNDAIRAPGSFDDVVRAITLIQDVKAALRKETPRVLIDTVITGSNVDDVPALVDLAKTLRVQEINVANLQCRTEAMERETAYSIDRDLLKERLEEAARKSAEGEVSLKLPAGFSLDAPTPCYWDPSKMIAITWDGKLRPCCFLFHDNTWALRGKTCHVKAPVFGNLVTEDFLSIWHKPRYIAFRKRAVSVEQKPEECRACLFAWGL